jgi:hypothetical protein
VTFNINTMSRAWAAIYHKRRDRIIRSMRQQEGASGRSEPVSSGHFWEEHQFRADQPAAVGTTRPMSKWEVRAKRYEETFRVARDKSEPSEWYILTFLIRLMFVEMRHCAAGVISRSRWRTLLGASTAPAHDEGSAAEEGTTRHQRHVITETNSTNIPAAELQGACRISETAED